MTTLGKDKLEELFYEINDMTNANEVHTKAAEISLSDIDCTARAYLLRATNIKLESLNSISPIIAESEYTVSDLDG